MPWNSRNFHEWLRKVAYFFWRVENTEQKIQSSTDKKEEFQQDEPFE